MNSIKYLPSVLFLFSFFSSYSLFATETLYPAFNSKKYAGYANNAEWQNRAIKYAPKLGYIDLSISLDQQQHPHLVPLIQKIAH
jgi:hypothetical protein